MEKLIGLHMDELLRTLEEVIIGRKWQRGWEMYRGATQGKGLVEAQKQGIELWRKKAEIERGGGDRKEDGKKEG